MYHLMCHKSEKNTFLSFVSSGSLNYLNHTLCSCLKHQHSPWFSIHEPEYWVDYYPASILFAKVYHYFSLVSILKGRRQRLYMMMDGVKGPRTNMIV